MTPASSPASCEDVCSRREERDDFVGLMDENGVIGLLEALEVVGAVEYRVRKTQPDEAGYRRSDAAPGEDAHVFPPSPGEICKRVSVLNAADYDGKRSASPQKLQGRKRRQPWAAHRSADGGIPTGPVNHRGRRVNALLQRPPSKTHQTDPAERRGTPTPPHRINPGEPPLHLFKASLLDLLK